MIGIFDSGLGGLTTARSLIEQMPGYDLIYFGDTARTPYGPKSRETVIRYSVQNTRLLVERGAEAIVVACNTASSVAVETLRSTFSVPIFEVITPAVQLAAGISKKGRIGVMGTRATVGSNIYEEKIKALNPLAKVYSKACPLLVPLVEEGWIDRPETRMIVKKYVRTLTARRIDTLILGCTHYPLLKKNIGKKAGKRVTLIDSSDATAFAVRNYLEKYPEIHEKLGREGNLTFLVSDITESFEKTASRFLNRKIGLTKVDFSGGITAGP